MSETRTIQFKREKLTKNTVRYAEVEEAGKPPVIGSLYIAKWAAGDAETAEITLALK